MSHSEKPSRSAFSADAASHSGVSRKFSAGGLLLAVLLVVAYSLVQRLGPTAPRPSDDVAPTRNAPEVVDDEPVDSSATAVEEEQPAPKSRAKVEAPRSFVVRNVTIRDLEGAVVYRGDVDLRPTLDRIDRGERLRFRNDGSVFRNREKRLPGRSDGYYREWVHPTPNVSGPGPQRVVTGGDGEAYYTHDHYETFRRVR